MSPAGWLLAAACGLPDPAAEEEGEPASASAASQGPTRPATLPDRPRWPGGDRVIRATTAVDGDGPRGPVHVVLDGPTVLALIPATVEIPPDVEVIDGEGRWVVPGLIDPHVHLALNGTPAWVGDTLPSTLRAYLHHGVTSVVDAGGPTWLFELRDRIARGEVLGPSVLALGPLLTTPLSHPCEGIVDLQSCVFVETAAEGEAAALHNLALGADGLKAALADADFSPWPTPRLPLEALQAAVAPVKAAGRLTYAHVDEVNDAIDALDAGVEHLAHPVFGGPPLSEAEAADLARRAQAIHTTISAFAGPLDLLAGSLPVDGPAAPPAVRAAWEATRRDPAWASSPQVAEAEAWTAQARESLATLSAAGAPLLPASDAGYWYIPHGLGLHRELAELEALGWTRLQVLRAATADAARWVGWSDRGTLAPGQRADLLLLDADPLQDLAALRTPRLVLLAGQPLDPLPLDVRLGGEASPNGTFCLDDRDCAEGRCDPIARRCALPCPAALALQDPCGPEAWCQPADGLNAADGVCHPARTCALYTPDPCSPAVYEETCAPTDLDTAVCFPSGPRAEREACDWSDPAQRCRPGLFCSNLDQTCYRTCDPALGLYQPRCPGGACRMQLGAGEPWFGLCLP